jgi:hypothetical protein
MTPTTSQHLARSIRQDRVAGATRDRLAASTAHTAEPVHHALPVWRLVMAIVGLRRIVAF